MPFKASKLETAYRIAAVTVVLLNDRNVPEEVTLNVKYRPLSLAMLEAWDAAEKKAVSILADAAKQPDAEDSVEHVTLARQLSEVVLDLDLVEDDGVTPKRVTLEYLKTLDLGFLKDVKRVIEERAFPEKKEFRDLMLSKALSSGT